MGCDPDNMALHFQTYKDSACSQEVPDGAQSIGTNTCTTIFGVGQIYTCSDYSLNTTAMKNALSASSIVKTETLVYEAHYAPLISKAASCGLHVRPSHSAFFLVSSCAEFLTNSVSGCCLCDQR